MPLQCWATQHCRSGSMLSVLPASPCSRQPPSSAVSAAAQVGSSQGRRHVPVNQATSLELDYSTGSSVHDQAQPLHLTVGLPKWHGAGLVNGATATNGQACHFILEPPDILQPQQAATAGSDVQGNARVKTAPAKCRTSCASSVNAGQQEPDTTVAAPAELKGRQLQGSTTTVVHRSVAQGMVSPPNRFPAPETPAQQQRQQLSYQHTPLPPPTAPIKPRKKRKRKPAGQPPHVAARPPSMTVSRTSGLDILQQYLQHQQSVRQEHQQPQHMGPAIQRQEHLPLHASSSTTSQLQPAVRVPDRRKYSPSGQVSSNTPPEAKSFIHQQPQTQQQQQRVAAQHTNTRATWLYLSPDSDLTQQAGDQARVYVQYSSDGKHWQAAAFAPVQTASGTRLWAASIPPHQPTPIAASIPPYQPTPVTASTTTGSLAAPSSAPTPVVRRRRPTGSAAQNLSQSEAGSSTQQEPMRKKTSVGSSRWHTVTGAIQVAVFVSAAKHAGPIQAPGSVVHVMSGACYLLHCQTQQLQCQQQQRLTHSITTAHSGLPMSQKQGWQEGHNAAPAATAGRLISRGDALGASSTAAGATGSSSYIPVTVQALPMLNQACLVVADLAMVAGRKQLPQDDHLCAQFAHVWKASQQVHTSMLLYNTHRSWTWFERMWHDKQAVLQQPDAVILSAGTRVMYQVAGGMWQEDHAWHRHISRLWNRDRVVLAVKRAAQMLQPCAALAGSQQQQHVTSHSQRDGRARLHAAHAVPLPAGLNSTAQMGNAQHQAATQAVAVLPDDSSQLCEPQVLLRPVGSQLAAGPSQHPPTQPVRADMQAEQGPHLVRVLVHQQVLQQFLEALQQELQAGSMAQGTAMHSHVHDSSGMRPVPPSVAAGPSNQVAHAAGTVAFCNDSQHTSSHSAAARYRSGTQSVTADQVKQQQQRQERLQRPQHYHSCRTQGPALAWQCVVQPPSVAGVRRGNWCVVDIIPQEAGPDAAVQHILRRFRIWPHAESLPVVRALAAAPASSSPASSPYTHTVLFRQRARVDSTPSSPTHTDQHAHLPNALANACITTQAWGAAGILDGLQQLGISGTVLAQ